MCELLWSDPQPGKGRSPNKRGVGVAFGPDVTRAFLELNSLDLLVRSHEVHLLFHLYEGTHQQAEARCYTCMIWLKRLMGTKGTIRR